MIIYDAQLEQYLIHLRRVWILIRSTDFFKYLNLTIDSIMMLSMLFEVQETQILSDVSSVLA